ncbi:Cytochrome c family protein [hydrothermal vent metagenome]|uniref:Cytochrome c family protein n=1 Tax=hydrothermal vent metagenome TaxID=652676 RepID=A0A3B0TTJ9_9ZZZZ
MIEKLKANALTLLLVGMVVLAAVIMFSRSGGGGVTVNVKVPNFSSVALAGEPLFNANCAACHGANAGGSDKAPPLIHTTYNPGHHADEAFFRAVENGVRAHHWKFGNMPRMDVPRPDIAKIIAYVRELQQANGIVTKPHNM